MMVSFAARIRGVAVATEVTDRTHDRIERYMARQCLNKDGFAERATGGGQQPLAPGTIEAFLDEAEQSQSALQGEGIAS